VLFGLLLDVKWLTSGRQYVEVVLMCELVLLCLWNSYKCDEFVVNDTLAGVIDSVRKHILQSSSQYVVDCITFLLCLPIYQVFALVNSLCESCWLYGVIKILHSKIDQMLPTHRNFNINRKPRRMNIIISYEESSNLWWSVKWNRSKRTDMSFILIMIIAEPDSS